MAKSQSEFGKGLVICLVKFAEHASEWIHTKDLYEKMRADTPSLFDESSAVHMYFNAASDHLYDIEIPPGNTPLSKKVSEFKEFALEIGHGFDPTKTWTEADVFKAKKMCQDIAMMIDKELGLKPDIGQF